MHDDVAAGENGDGQGYIKKRLSQRNLPYRVSTGCGKDRANRPPVDIADSRTVPEILASRRPF